MKKIFYLLLPAFALLSCEKDLPLYENPDNRLNFFSSDNAQLSETYSFIYNSQKEIDTIWRTVRTLGFLSDEDRYFELMQITGGTDDAIPGVHYVSFDDPEMKKHYFIPAGAVEARIPIVVKKDASLDDKNVRLNVTFADNGTFRAGYAYYAVYGVTISNQLGRPQNWSTLCNHYFGTYGRVKHQFMIDVSGEKWDDDYLLNELKADSPRTADQGYWTYLGKFFYNELEKLNQTRADAGLEPLKEANGTLVTIPFE